VAVYRERRALALSLSDMDTAVKKLHRTLDVVLALTVLIVWLLILGISPMHLLVFVFSQMLLIAFLFGNVCKTLVEAIIFMFIMHPFDVGDRCVIDGVQVNNLANCDMSSTSVLSTIQTTVSGTYKSRSFVYFIEKNPKVLKW